MPTRTITIALLVLFLLAGCTAAAPAATPVPPAATSVPTPVSTAVPAPTATPAPPTKTPVPTAVPPTPVPTALPPLTGSGGGVLAFVSERGGSQDVYLMNADGSDQRQYTTGLGNDGWCSWSPDGTQVAYHSFDSGRSTLRILTVATGATRRLPVNLGGNKWEPAWSHSGEWIAFSNQPTNGVSEIYLIRPDGTDLRRLTDNKAVDAAPLWSPDDRQIAFVSERDGNFELYMMDANGGNPLRLTDDPGEDILGGWSPDGSRIAFFSNREGRYQLYLIRPDGSDLVRLLDTPTDDWYPAWSPDGTRIAYASGKGSDTDIYVMNADGTGAQRLTDSPGLDFAPVWRPQEPPVPPLVPTPNPRCNISARASEAARPDTAHTTDFWRLSTPEEQGMDAQLLAEGLATLTRSASLYSFLVVRHDVLVVEQYYNGSDQNDSRHVASVTKSFISALVGIAVEKGYLAGSQQKLSDLLPSYFTTEANQPKKGITLQNLLTMASGLEPASFLSGADWIQDALANPLVTEPGAHFWYDSMLPHIMAVLISKSSGMSTCEFAYQYLLEPLDLTTETWDRDAQGNFVGAATMSFTPRELATFGLLYLHQGEWNGTQLIPAAWIEESLQAHVHVERQSDVNPDAGWWLAPEVTGYDAEFDYGYYWWITTISSHPVYSAIGWGGQRLHLIPDLDMVIVTTSREEPANQIIDSFGLIEQYIIPATGSR